MTTERADRLRQLFADALNHDLDERAAFLDAACADDPDLRQELDGLLQADALAQVGDLLRTPALDLASALTSPDPLSGQSIGPYRLIRRIGQGGMGEVYLARRDAPFKQQVALKLIRQGFNTPEALQRFEMERQILASLTHPHIGRLLDGGTTGDGLSYLVMEYVEGEPITQYCDTRHFTVEQRVRLFQQVCQAVHYAHQNLVVHRDLKPSNILVTREGTVKLLDFGVAKLLNPVLTHVEVPVTRTMFRLMTPEYAAPEQVRGETVTTATDVYALGVLLYELLTGHRPYHLKSNSPMELERVICLQEPERPSTRVGRTVTLAQEEEQEEARMTPEEVGAARSMTTEQLARRLRGDLDNIVLKALRKEPHLRYASAEQLGADLERYELGLPVEARASTMGYRVAKFAHRHKVGVAAAMLIVVLLAGFAIAMGVQQAATARERDRAEQARVTAEQALAQSETVTDFLMGLFEASDPYQTIGDTLTSHELLALGVERAEALAGEPEVQAKMLSVIGKVYERLEDYDKAEALLTRALDMQRRELGEEHLDVAESMESLAWLYIKIARFEEALPLARQALAIHRKQLGEEHPRIATSLNDMAGLLEDMGAYDEAEPLYREALAMRTRLLPEGHEDHEFVGVSQNNLALLLWRKGHYDEAARLFRESLVIHRKELDANHPFIASGTANLGLVLAEQGDLKTAESLIREALARSLQLTGEEHPTVAINMHNLARILRDQGDYAAAEPLMLRALDIRRQTLPPGHPRIAQSLNDLAVLRYRTGDLTAAEPLFRDALAMRRQALPPQHPDIARSLSGLASLLRDQGDYATAERYYQEAQAIFLERLGADHPDIRRLYTDLAKLYDTWGKPEEAAQYLPQTTSG